MSEHLLIGSIGDSRGAERLAAERVLESAAGRVGVVLETGRERPRPASLLAPGEAKELESELLEALPELEPKARGSLVYLSAAQSERLAGEVISLREIVDERPLAVIAGAGRYRELLELGWDRVVIRSDEAGQDAPEVDAPVSGDAVAGPGALTGLATWSSKRQASSPIGSNSCGARPGNCGPPAGGSWAGSVRPAGRRPRWCSVASSHWCWRPWRWSRFPGR